jgi:hypothetical protein
MRTKSDFRKCEQCGGTGKAYTDKLARMFVFIRDNSSYEKPIKSKAIEAEFGIAGSAVRMSINAMQAHHWPVGSKHDGYYIAINSKQLNDQKNHVLHRIDGLFRKLWHIEETQKEMAKGNISLPHRRDCPDCFGTGEVMVNTNVYDDLITVGGHNSGTS